MRLPPVKHLKQGKEFMNTTKYSWLDDLESPAAKRAIEAAKELYNSQGAVLFHDFLTKEALDEASTNANAKESAAFLTDDVHTAYLKDSSDCFPPNSVFNHKMQTKVASIAYDELPKHSALSNLYRDPRLLRLVQLIVGAEELYLSNDPLGCCSINVFRPGDFHSFHFDESVFSTTLMLQDDNGGGGLFQYTRPLRTSTEDLALTSVANAIQAYDDRSNTTSTKPFDETCSNESPPLLQTLDFTPGTLSIFSGSRSLHRVTKVVGSRSRLVAVLTFSTIPNFCNSAKVQKLFWGRSAMPQEDLHTSS